MVAYQFPQPGLHFTISIGMAEIHPGIGSVKDWVVAADTALYSAKQRGRDCIDVARLPAALQTG